jgi:hypothetical protein
MVGSERLTSKYDIVKVDLQPSDRYKAVSIFMSAVEYWVQITKGKSCCLAEKGQH